MIIITGAAGFIGGYLCRYLNQVGYKDLVLVDDFTRTNRKLNYETCIYHELVERDEFFTWLDKSHRFVQMIIHLGARTDTAEFDYTVLEKLNVHYTQKMWKRCVQYALPLIYASSAATYGMGENGYEDNEAIVDKLSPLNPYGVSKNELDKWAIKQEKKPFYWAGLKFFNVYGPYENHKGRMASVVYHAYKQIKQNGTVKLFKSHHPSFKDGEQLRDFIYVEDVAKMIVFLMENRKQSGLYNIGSGNPRTFKALVEAVFSSLDLIPQIEFIDTPLDIRDKYQYYTAASMDKLVNIGYPHTILTLEEGVDSYVKKLQDFFE